MTSLYSRSAVLIAVLSCIAPRASAATRTWTGTTSGLWNLAANWGGSLPQAGDDLVFPAAASNKTNTNDFPAGTGFNSITFTGNGYNLAGNSIALGASGITQNHASVGENTIALNLVLAATRPILFVNSPGGLRISVAISGSGGLTVNEASRFRSSSTSNS